MRLALVWLNMDSPVGVSHGVLILARELADAGHQVRVLHLHEALDRSGDPGPLLAELTRDQVALVGLSFTSPHAAEARRLAHALKEGLPDVHLLCGGIHATLDPEDVLRWPGVDAVGLGELDGGGLVTYVDRLDRGEIPTDQPGFWVRVGDVEHKNPMAPLPDLTHQALPRYEGLDVEGLVRAKRGFGEVLSGRGCPYRCRFCQNHALVERYRESLGGSPGAWPYVRQRGVENLLQELRELRARAPSLKAIMFADDRLAADRAWLREFAERYPAEIGLPFIINATLEQLDSEVAGLLARAGCNMVKLGVECAPGRLRREVLGRPFGAERIAAAFAHLQAVGINTMAYLMIGIPGETEEDLLQTFRFCAGLRPDAVRVSMFCPYPGTRIYQDLAASGALGSATAVGDFLSSSVLTWPPAMVLLLDQALRMHLWLLNLHLDPPVHGAAALVAWIRELDGEAWSGKATRAELDRREAELLQTLSRGRIPHYRAPFPERPDYAFLRVDRRRPLINVDS
jgi:radical SAM superfamily enzyme YgiQ (UPF0313 family)